MKKIVAVCFACILASTGFGVVATYVPTLVEIDSMFEVTPGDLTYGPDAAGAWDVLLSGSVGQFIDVQIGRDATIEGVGSAFYSGSWVDLSGYGAYALTISNTSTESWFMANVYLNTGYTDSGESDHYFQNTWTWLAPGQTTTLTLDFSAAEAWYDGVSQGVVAVDNLTHVSSIGFNVGSNYGCEDYQGICLEGMTTPEPATLVLLGLGGLLLRKRG